MYYPVSAHLIEFLILSVLQKEDSYGYEISRTVKLVADIKESTLYPILKKLEKNGFMTTYTKEYQGRKRKYYFHAGNSYQKRFRQKRQNLQASLLKNG